AGARGEAREGSAARARPAPREDRGARRGRHRGGDRRGRADVAPGRTGPGASAAGARAGGHPGGRAGPLALGTNPMALTVRNRALIRFMSRLHVFLYRLTGGWLGGSVNGLPVLLLTHKGRKTGALYVTPLMHLRDGERYVIIASNAGAAA